MFSLVPNTIVFSRFSGQPDAPKNLVYSRARIVLDYVSALHVSFFSLVSTYPRRVGKKAPQEVKDMVKRSLVSVILLTLAALGVEKNPP